ncbi:MAG TPA: hypothetical protein VIZ66_10940 [Sphingomicrobium sp.]
MNRTIKFAAAFALATSSLTATAAAADKPVEMTPTEMAAAQARTYSVPSNVAFTASISALQTLGYIDINASKDAGTISAQTEAKGKIIYNILWGVGKKKRTQKASILVEDNGPTQSRVRLNLLEAEAKSRGLFGTAFTDGKMVKFAEPYGAFFSALDSEIARRSAAAPAAVPAPAAVTPVSAPAEPAATPAPGN